ncbi:MAG: O-antigen ligase family protein [Planctomycetota bacterium]
MKPLEKAAAGVIVALAIVVPIANLPAFFPSPNALKWTIFLLGAAVAAGLFGLEAFSAPAGLRRPRAWAPLAAFLGWSLLSSFQAMSVEAAVLALWRTLAGVTIFLLALSLFRDAAAWRRLLGAVFIAVIAVSLHGFWQFSHAGDYLPAGGGVYSTFGNANFAAEFLAATTAIALAVALSLGNSPGTESPGKTLFPVLGIIAAAAGFLCLLATYTRGGWIGFAAGVALLAALILWRRFPARGLVIALVALGLLATAYAFVLDPMRQAAAPAGVPSAFAGRIFSITDTKFNSNRVRLLTWQGTLRMTAKEPFFGVGPGNFERAYPPYRPDAERKITGANTVMNAAHNDYLQTASETGIPGLILLLAFIAAVVAGAIRALARPESSPEDKCLLAGLLAGLGTFLTHAVVSFPLENPASSLLFWLILAGLTALSGNAVPLTLGRPAAVAGMVGAGLGTLAAAGLGVSHILDHHAEQLVRQGKPAAGIARHQAALAVFPWREETRLALAQTIFQRAMETSGAAAKEAFFARSLELIEDSLTRAPFSILALHQRLLLAASLGKEALFENTARRIGEIEPRDTEVPFNRGLLAHARKDYLAEIAANEETLALDSHHGKAWANLLAAHRKAGHVEESVKLFETARTAVPNETALFLNQARFEKARGNRDRAKAILNDILARKPADSALLEERAHLALDEKDIRGTEEYLRRAAEAAPFRADLRVFLGELLVQTGRRAEAVREWEAAIAIEPGNEKARKYLETTAHR